MRIDRRDLKWRARDAMRTACPNPLLLTFVYLLLTAGLEGVVSWWATDPLSRLLDLSQQGLTLDRAIGLMLHTVGRFGLFLTLLMTIWEVVVKFGYKFWCLRTARGEQGELGDLMAGFSMVGRILWLQILILMYSFLWYMVVSVPVAFLIVMLGTWMGFGMWILLMSTPGFYCVALLIFGLWFLCVVRYAMAAFCLMDEPEMGASWALRRSRQMMRGRGKDYVLLLLSFVGWLVLNGLIVTAVEGALAIALGGVQVLIDPQAAQVIGSSPIVSILPALASWPLSLWLKPYVTLTECNFYERIKGGAQGASI